MSNVPNCIIIPSSSGSISNCITMQMPSISKLIAMLIISWIIFMIVAYVIYWFLEKTNPLRQYSYWMILLILIVAGLIVSLIFK